MAEEEVDEDSNVDQSEDTQNFINSLTFGDNDKDEESFEQESDEEVEFKKPRFEEESENESEESDYDTNELENLVLQQLQ